VRIPPVALAFVVACGGDAAPRVSVGAATVLRHAMPELTAEYERSNGVHIDAVYGASDTLAARKPDVLVLADETKLTKPTEIATTIMVLVGPADAAYRCSNLLDSEVVAIGDPASVPAGRYARDYLTTLGIWDAVQPRLVYGGDVLGVLAQAQKGTSHVAIVYATDVEDAAPLVVLDRAINGPVVHIAAAVASKVQAGATFVTWLTSPPAQKILAKHGFSPISGVVR